jgi:hypothetical protein
MNISLAPNVERFELGVREINKSDIYSGKETIGFNNRHPIFKTLMKLEFEEVLRKYHKLTLIE